MRSEKPGTTRLRGTVVLVLWTTVWLAGCSPADPRAELFDRVAAAFRTGDIRAFRRTTITAADLLLREAQVSSFAAANTFAGGVLRPEEQARQDASFERCLRPGNPASQWIDFSTAEVIGPGTCLQSGGWELLSGSVVPQETWSLRVRQGGAELDTRDLFPRLRIVPVAGRWKVIELVVPDSTP